MAAQDRAREWAPWPQAPEPEPETYFINDWFTPWFRRWSRAFYGNRGFFIAWGWIFWLIVLPYIVAKATLFFGVALLVLLAFFCTAMYDVLTVRRRLKRA